MSKFKVIKANADNLEFEMNKYQEFKVAEVELSRPESAMAVLEKELSLQDSKTAAAGGDVTPDAGYDAMKKVVVPLEATKTVTANGTVTPASGKVGMTEVVVNVTPNLQSKTVSIATLVAGGTITADTGYDGLGTITLEA